jgi:hypothetical protein
VPELDADVVVELVPLLVPPVLVLVLVFVLVAVVPLVVPPELPAAALLVRVVAVAPLPLTALLALALTPVLAVRPLVEALLVPPFDDAADADAEDSAVVDVPPPLLDEAPPVVAAVGAPELEVAAEEWVAAAPLLDSALLEPALVAAAAAVSARAVAPCDAVVVPTAEPCPRGAEVPQATNANQSQAPRWFMPQAGYCFTTERMPARATKIRSVPVRASVGIKKTPLVFGPSSVPKPTIERPSTRSILSFDPSTTGGFAPGASMKKIAFTLARGMFSPTPDCDESVKCGAPTSRSCTLPRFTEPSSK